MQNLTYHCPVGPPPPPLYATLLHAVIQKCNFMLENGERPKLLLLLISSVTELFVLNIKPSFLNMPIFSWGPPLNKTAQHCSLRVGGDITNAHANCRGVVITRFKQVLHLSGVLFRSTMTSVLMRLIS